MVNLIKKNFDRFRHVGLYFFSSCFSSCVGVLLNPLYAANLSHEDYAILGYYSSYNLLLLPLLHFSLFSFFTRQYYVIEVKLRDELENTVLKASLILGIIMLILFTLTFYLVHHSIGLTIPFYPYALLTFVQVYISNTLSFYLIKLRIKRNASRFAIISICQCIVINCLSILLVVIYKLGAEGKLWGALGGTILMVLFVSKDLFTGKPINIDILKKGLSFSFPLMLSALLWYFVSGVDRFFLERLHDPIQLGLYSVALSSSAYMTIFYTSVANTFEPDLYKAIANNETKKIKNIIATILSVVLIFNIIFIIFTPLVLDLLTAGRYIAAAHLARILALHNITMAIYYMIVKLLVGYGLTTYDLIVRIIGSSTSMIAYYFLINEYQFYGAAWGQVASFAILSIIGAIILYCKRTTLIQSKG